MTDQIIYRDTITGQTVTAEYAKAHPDTTVRETRKAGKWRRRAEAAEAKLAAIEADDDDKLSIMSGWLVYDMGEHTCGGYGPESGYAHEPGCGFEPVLRLDELQGWPEVERLTTAVRRVRALHRESRGSLSALYPNPICECGKDYPCPTIRALDGTEAADR